MLQVSNLSIHLSEEPLFEGASFALGAGARVGLVGPNGSGKTTLLRLLAGGLQPTEGTVETAGGCRRVYLGTRNDTTVGDFLDAELFRAWKQVSDLEQRLDESLLEAYGEALEAFQTAGGHARVGRWRRPLTDAGLADLDWDRPLKTLSGGQASRLALARLAGTEADLLLLDEPSASLDADGLERLERFLETTPAAVVLVSHDRRLLDRVTTRTLALDQRRVREYGGNYSFYRARKAEEEARAWREFEDQQRRVRRLEAAVKGLKDHAQAIESTSQNDFYRGVAKGVAAKAKSRQTRLERMLSHENRAEKPRRTERMRLDLSGDRLAGARLLAAEGLSARTIHDIDVEVVGGRRIALTGPNGAGKSTLLDALAGDLPSEGRLWRRPDLRLGRLAQTAADLRGEASSLELLRDLMPGDEGEARTFLHRFLLTGHETLRPARTLSDGQRMRLALALLMASEPDLLLLDEPTSHLDLDTVEALEDALASYRGAVLAVSHDREFLDRLEPDETWRMDGGVLVRTVSGTPASR